MKGKLSRKEFLAAGLRTALAFYLARFVPGGKIASRSDLGQYWVESVQINPPGLGPQTAIVGVGRAGCLAVRKVAEALSQRAEFPLVRVVRPSLLEAIALNPETIDLALVFADVSEDTARVAAALGSLFREAGALTIGMMGDADVVFTTSGRRTVSWLTDHVDTIVLQASRERDFAERAALMAHGAVCIMRLLVEPGPICLDFVDIREIMRGSGLAYMGRAAAVGEGSLLVATCAATRSVAAFAPLERARRLLLGLGVGPEVTLSEVSSSAEQVFRAAQPDSEIIYSVNLEPSSVPPRAEATLFVTDFEGFEGRG